MSPASPEDVNHTDTCRNIGITKHPPIGPHCTSRQFVIQMDDTGLRLKTVGLIRTLHEGKNWNSLFWEFMESVVHYVMRPRERVLECVYVYRISLSL